MCKRCKENAVAQRVGAQLRNRDMSPSGRRKEYPPVTAVTRQSWVEARLILLVGLVVSTLDAPENKAERLRSLKYMDRPWGREKHGKTSSQMQKKKPDPSHVPRSPQCEGMSLNHQNEKLRLDVKSGRQPVMACDAVFALPTSDPLDCLEMRLHPDSQGPSLGAGRADILVLAGHLAANCSRLA